MSKIHFIAPVDGSNILSIDGKVRIRLSQGTACGLNDYYVNLVTEQKSTVTCKKCLAKLRKP